MLGLNAVTDWSQCSELKICAPTKTTFFLFLFLAHLTQMQYDLYVTRKKS
jgi:hypothetical protein